MIICLIVGIFGLLIINKLTRKYEDEQILLCNTSSYKLVIIHDVGGPFKGYTEILYSRYNGYDSRYSYRGLIRYSDHLDDQTLKATKGYKLVIL